MASNQAYNGEYGAPSASSGMGMAAPQQQAQYPGFGSQPNAAVYGAAWGHAGMGIDTTQQQHAQYPTVGGQYGAVEYGGGSTIAGMGIAATQQHMQVPAFGDQPAAVDYTAFEPIAPVEIRWFLLRDPDVAADHMSAMSRGNKRKATDDELTIEAVNYANPFERLASKDWSAVSDPNWGQRDPAAFAALVRDMNGLEAYLYTTAYMTWLRATNGPQAETLWQELLRRRVEREAEVKAMCGPVLMAKRRQGGIFR
ncbi:hypothetical protein LTR08_003122 [Meristemomyces frigidus]|nr:hypothetical protein LTR08_003122 [Meristemomyces frigidus]